MITRPPDHLLTLAEWEALPEDNSRHFELQEGVLIGRPKAPMLHQEVLVHLMVALYHQLPAEWRLVLGVEVVTDAGFLASVRVPDLVIARADTMKANLPYFTSDQVLIAVEIISPGSRGIDTLVKPVEYAEAGIPYYWVVDLDGELSLTAFHLAGNARYHKEPAVTGLFETKEPFSVRIELTAGRDK